MTARREGAQVDTFPEQMYGITSVGDVKKLAVDSDGKILLSSDSLSGYVPYTGATNDVDLGNHYLTCGGTQSGQSIIASGMVINEDGGNLAQDDFRVETVGNANAFVVDASANIVEINTGIQYAYVAKTASYTLTANDYQVECTANTFTITLPTAVSIEGRVYSIKNTGTGTITVDGNGAETIDGATTQTLNQWDNMMIMSDNTNWIII